MEYVLLTLLVIHIICILYCFWAVYCVDKTYQQRHDIMPSVGDPDFWNKMDAFDRVSFDKHHWYLITLRDPMKLYESKQ